MLSKSFEATCTCYYFETKSVYFKHPWICYEFFCFLLKYVFPLAWLIVQVFSGDCVNSGM